MDVHIELAAEPHIPVLLDLQADFYAIDNYPFNRILAEQVLRHFLHTPNLGQMWVFKPTAGAGIIGYLALTFGYSFEFGGKIAFIDEFYLAPPYRGSGWGKQILQYVLQQAEKLELRVLHLEAERHNQAGKALYHRFGFRDHDRHLLTKKLYPDK